MSVIITRASKGSPLSWAEADSNLENLNTDKLESSDLLPYATTASVNLAISNMLETTDIGTSVQAHSPNLDEYATINPTAAGLALLDDVDTAAQRSTLGLGTAATQAATAFAASGAIASSGLTQSTGKLIGRSTAGTGAPEEITVGTGLSLSASTLSVTSSGITLLTEQSTTSGSTKDFTGIPSTAKRVTIMFVGVSTSGSAVPLIRIGAGSIDSSGYSCAHGQVVNGGSSVVSNSPTTGFGFNGNTWSSGIVLHGKVELNLVNASTNTWTISGVVARMDGVIDLVSGSKALSGALDRVQISTTDAFDAGAINVSYE